MTFPITSFYIRKDLFGLDSVKVHQRLCWNLKGDGKKLSKKDNIFLWNYDHSLI